MIEISDMGKNIDFDRNSILEEISTIVHYSKINLNDSGKNKKDIFKQEQAKELINKLKNEIVSLPPRPIVREITKDRPSTNVSRLEDKSYSHYEIEIPVSVFPKSGWAFTRIECLLEFWFEKGNGKDYPIVCDLFPEKKWISLLSLGGELTVNVSENFEFSLDKNKNYDAVDLPLGMKGNVNSSLNSKLEAKTARFKYSFEKAEIQTAGKGNSFARWRFDGIENIEKQELFLKVILQIPHGLESSLSSKAIVMARHDFQIWTSDILKDWRPYFSEAIISFLKGGAFVHDISNWPNLIK